MAGWILKLAQSEPELVQVAIEVPHGPVVESLLNRGFQVHSINPRQLDRFRDRFSPAGAKDDSRDAHVLADALRTDPRCLRRLEPLDPLLVELREWSRIAEELTRLRTRLSHRLRDQLWRYYPQFLDLGSDLANNWMLALWAVVPTPDRARMVSKATRSASARAEPSRGGHRRVLPPLPSNVMSDWPGLLPTSCSAPTFSCTASDAVLPCDKAMWSSQRCEAESASRC